MSNDETTGVFVPGDKAARCLDYLAALWRTCETETHADPEGDERVAELARDLELAMLAFIIVALGGEVPA